MPDTSASGTSELKFEVPAQDLVDELQEQRNRALGEAAQAKAVCRALMREVADLREQLANRAQRRAAASTTPPRKSTTTRATGRKR